MLIGMPIRECQEIGWEMRVHGQFWELGLHQLIFYWAVPLFLFVSGVFFYKIEERLRVVSSLINSDTLATTSQSKLDDINSKLVAVFQINSSATVLLVIYTAMEFFNLWQRYQYRECYKFYGDWWLAEVEGAIWVVIIVGIILGIFWFAYFRISKYTDSLNGLLAGKENQTE